MRQAILCLKGAVVHIYYGIFNDFFIFNDVIFNNPTYAQYYCIIPPT